MKNFKRALAILLAVMMVLPMAVVSSAASGTTLEDNWTLFGGKYTASTGIYHSVKGKTGFTMTENAEGGIDVHVPNGAEYTLATANTPVSYVYGNNVTPLDNLSVTMKVSDGFNFSGIYSNHIGIMWTKSKPISVEDIKSMVTSQSQMKDVFGPSYSGLVFRESVLKNGFRGFVNAQTKDTGILVSLDSSSNGLVYTEEFTGKVASRVCISLYDGLYTDCNDGYGYRWSYVAQNFEPHCPNGDYSDVYSFSEAINVADGVTVEFRPDATLGYIVNINGKDFNNGKEVGAFPNDQGQITVDDTLNKTEKYLNSMYYARADIDLSALVGVGDGYLAAGVTGRQESDVECDYTIVSVNGVPAAQWAGEANTHTHSFAVDTANSIPATCTSRGYTFYKCACGAVKHPQLVTYFEVDPAVTYTAELKALADLNLSRVIWEDTYPTAGDQNARNSWLTAQRYAIKYKAYIAKLSDEAFEDHILGHNYVESSRVDATCATAGTLVSVCDRCSDVKEETLPALGHKFSTWKVADGGRTRTCSVCNEVETIVDPTSDNPYDYWQLHAKNELSRLSGVGTIGEVNDNTATLTNNNGALVVEDSRADVTFSDETSASMVFVPVTRIMSKFTNKLDGFSVTVKPTASPNGEYNTALAFIWTTTPENYDGYREYSVEAYQDKIEWASLGFLWNSFVPNYEYSFSFVFLDQLFTDTNHDGVCNGAGEIQIGTLGDGIYDAVMYVSVNKAEVWSSGYGTIKVPMADGVSLTLGHTVDGITYSVNGGSTYVAQNMQNSQLFTDGYYFGIASNSLSNYGSSAFVVEEICGSPAATYTGVVPGTVEDPVEEPHTHVYTATVTKEATCTEKGVKTFTCECGDSYTEDIPALGHTFGEWVVESASTCVVNGVEKRTCSICSVSETRSLELAAHTFGEWSVVTPATTTTEGLERRTCSVCGATEDRAIAKLPEETPIAYLENYNFIVPEAANVNYIRLAPGSYTTASEIKNAAGMISISGTALTNGRDETGKYTYEVPSAGVYSAWIRYTDGTQKIVSDMNNYVMTQEVVTYGPTVTVKNLYGVRDFFISRGTQTTYANVKANQVVRISSAADLANKSYTYGAAMPNEGDYTVYVRYTDTARPAEFIYFNVTVTHPEISVYGRTVSVSNIDNVKTIRIAQGTYTTASQVKAAAGCRTFATATIAKVIKDGVVTIVNVAEAEGTTYTVYVEYKDKWSEIHTVTVHKKVPTYVKDGNTITFTDLAGLTLFRYVPGTYGSPSVIKNAPGSKFIRPADVQNNTIELTGLTGKYTFLVEYDDMSRNIINLVF